jgi:hypothetical protein
MISKTSFLKAAAFILFVFSICLANLQIANAQQTNEKTAGSLEIFYSGAQQGYLEPCG